VKKDTVFEKLRKEQLDLLSDIHKKPQKLSYDHLKAFVTNPLRRLRLLVKWLEKGNDAEKDLAISLTKQFIITRRPISKTFIKNLASSGSISDAQKYLEKEAAKLQLARIGLGVPKALPYALTPPKIPYIFEAKDSHAQNTKIDYSDSEPEDSVTPEPYWIGARWGNVREKWRVRNYTKKDRKKQFVNNYISEKEFKNLVQDNGLNNDADTIHAQIENDRDKSTTVLTVLMQKISPSHKQSKNPINDYKCAAVKKFLFINRPISKFFKNARIKAETLGYHLVYSPNSHAEGALIQFHAIRPQYKLVSIGCNRDHCIECHRLLSLHYGSNYPTTEKHVPHKHRKSFDNYYMPPTLFCATQKNFIGSFTTNHNILHTNKKPAAYTKKYYESIPKLLRKDLGLSLRTQTSSQNLTDVVLRQIKKHLKLRGIARDQKFNEKFTGLFQGVDSYNATHIRLLSLRLESFLKDIFKTEYHLLFTFFEVQQNKQDYTITKFLDSREIHPDISDINIDHLNMMPVQIAYIKLNQRYYSLDYYLNQAAEEKGMK